MAQFSYEDINTGFKAAQTRLANFDWEISPNLDNLMREPLADALVKHPEPLSQRFVILLSEVTTISVAARQRYNHPALDSGAIASFIKTAGAFVNSFTHDEP